MGKTTKKTTEKTKLEEIKEVFEKEDTNNNKAGLILCDKAIFMEQTLTKLQAKIEEKGVVTKMCQGSYSIDRENPALKSYTSLIKNFNSTMKQITDLLPKEESNEDDAFEDF